MRLTRPLATFVAAALFAVTAVIVTPGTGQAADGDPVLATDGHAAASWLVGELGSDGLVEGFTQGSATSDAILSLAIADLGGDAATAAVDALAGIVDGYVADGGTVNGGRAAYALLAANADGRDVNDFGGRDLEADLRGSIGTDGSAASNAFSQALAVSAMSVVATGADDDDLVDVTQNLATTCSADGCGGFFDAVPLAVGAFLDADAVLEEDYSDDAAELADLLEQEQQDDGSVGSFPNSNTASLAAWALRLVGRTGPADDARDFTATLQLGAAAADAGAVLFTEDARDDAQANGGEIQGNQRGSAQGATAQALRGLTDSVESLADATTADDTAGTPAATAVEGACPDDTGVTLVVDPIDLGDDPQPELVCVTSFAGMNSLDLLLAGGFTVNFEDSQFGPSVCQIEGLPSDLGGSCFGSADQPNGFWQLFVGTADSVGWESAQVGAGSDNPVDGDVRGWAWESDFSDDDPRRPRVAPAATDDDSEDDGTGDDETPGTFTDDEGSIFERDIERFAAAGITRGCNPPANDRFCPDDSLTRAEMAAFLNRALDLPAAEEQFSDVAADNIFADDIGAVAAAGITRGCNPPANDRFCPDELVPREQMAAFLNRALEIPAAEERFTDVGDDDIFADDIGAIAAAGITRGCNPPANDRFCPDQVITRAQTAAFFVRAGLTDEEA